MSKVVEFISGRTNDIKDFFNSAIRFKLRFIQVQQVTIGLHFQSNV